ncbi:MAG: hypothetical protein JWR84_946 [Caulobacter sp.]|nr:hypothetical protein [Caulobacter sp.]
MTPVAAQDLPAGALIAPYRDAGCYTDCFVTSLPGNHSQESYVEAFYTSWLFKLERLVLATLVARPSTDLQTRRLAAGEVETFAAWSVEARGVDQIVMCDYQKLTRSWLMSRRDGTVTILYFGTVVAPRVGDRISGRVFRAFEGLHRLYARALLRAAAGRLLRRP